MLLLYSYGTAQCASFAKGELMRLHLKCLCHRSSNKCSNIDLSLYSLNVTFKKHFFFLRSLLDLGV